MTSSCGSATADADTAQAASQGAGRVRPRFAGLIGPEPDGTLSSLARYRYRCARRPPRINRSGRASRSWDMRYGVMCAAGLGLLAMSANVNVAVAAGVSEAKAPIVLAQAETKKSETKKSETVTQKVKKGTKKIKRSVKRAWRNMTGYKFDVGCPVLIPLSHKTCTETGKNVEDARAKCQSQNPLCSVTQVK